MYDSVCNTSFFPFPSKNLWVLVVGWFGFFFSLESAATDKSDQQRLQYESVFENWSANTGEKNKTFYRRHLLPFLLSCPNIIHSNAMWQVQFQYKYCNLCDQEYFAVLFLRVIPIFTWDG